MKILREPCKSLTTVVYDDVAAVLQNPDLIILERQHFSSQQAFIGKNFSLPRDATPGTWFITAYYEGNKVTETFTCLEFGLLSHSSTDVTRSVVSRVIRVTSVERCYFSLLLMLLLLFYSTQAR